MTRGWGEGSCGVRTNQGQTLTARSNKFNSSDSNGASTRHLHAVPEDLAPLSQKKSQTCKHISMEMHKNHDNAESSGNGLYRVTMWSQEGRQNFLGSSGKVSRKYQEGGHREGRTMHDGREALTKPEQHCEPEREERLHESDRPRVRQTECSDDDCPKLEKWA